MALVSFRQSITFNGEDAGMVVLGGVEYPRIGPSFRSWLTRTPAWMLSDVGFDIETGRGEVCKKSG